MLRSILCYLHLKHLCTKFVALLCWPPISGHLSESIPNERVQCLTVVRSLQQCQHWYRCYFVCPADKSSPFNLVQALSSQLQEVPAEDVLTAMHNVPQVGSLSA